MGMITQGSRSSYAKAPNVFVVLLLQVQRRLSYIEQFLDNVRDSQLPNGEQYTTGVMGNCIKTLMGILIEILGKDEELPVIKMLSLCHHQRITDDMVTALGEEISKQQVRHID